MEQCNLSTKINAVAMACLMLAATLAWGTLTGPTSTEKTAFYNLANSTVSSAYTTLTTLSNELKNASVALNKWANAAEADGTTAYVQRQILNEQSKFLAPLTDTQLQERYKEAQNAGYKGGYLDFTKWLKSITLTQKKEALSMMKTIGLYGVMLKGADAYLQASKNAAAMAESIRNGSFRGAKLTLTSFTPTLRPVFFNLPSCAGFDIGFALFGIAGALIPETGIGLGMMIVSIAWGGVRDFFC